MKKILLLLATALATQSGYAQIQPCGTDEMRQQLLAEHPELLQFEAELEKQLEAGMRQFDFRTAAKTTAVDQTDNPNFWYDIPIVIHIIHDYNTYSTSTFSGDYIPDDFIFKTVNDWNIVFAKKNADTADVIAPFKKYIGNARIRLHLATKDPNGNPTKGITRRRSYLTYNGGNDAKFDGWSPTSYINLWFINKMSAANSNAAAYAYKPAAATYIPFYDGVISLAGYMNNGSKTMPHELGHVLNLSHTWGDNNQPNIACGDDNVDDTPPTKGHATTGCTFASLYDTTCCGNYYKLYTDILGEVYMINYPDTTNSQNIMDYTYCDKMFTKGQVYRMHQTLNSNIAGRNNLWDSTNLVMTGAMAPMPDLKPIPDFNVVNISGGSYLAKNANFAFPDKEIRFINQTQNDTLDALNWTFTNGASSPTSTSTTNFTNSFSEPGWVTVTMKATGNNTGDTTVVFDKSVYVTERTGYNTVAGYFQEFNESGDRNKWPMFNYYNNEFKWQYANVGAFDNASLMYKGYDDRVTATSGPITGSPKGDFDDVFSLPVDLTGWGGTCNLNFFYSGASRSSISTAINDSLYIDYTINKGTTWVSLAKIGKGDLLNRGTVTTPYVPTSNADWAPKTIALPSAAITNYTTFRFRYKPGAGSNGVTSSGNNFYMDRIHFASWPASASDIKPGVASVAVVPNPTVGDAWVIVSDATNTTATITVTDITGKVVYSAEQAVKGTQARILIPAAHIAAKGIYLIQTVTGSQMNTQKLVVY